MERVIMKYVNKNKDYCLLIGKDEDLYVMNLDKKSVYILSPMDSLLGVLEDIDVEEDNIFVNRDDLENLMFFIQDNEDDLGTKLMCNLLSALRVTK